MLRRFWFKLSFMGVVGREASSSPSSSSPPQLPLKSNTRTLHHHVVMTMDPPSSSSNILQNQPSTTTTTTTTTTRVDDVSAVDDVRMTSSCTDSVERASCIGMEKEEEEVLRDKLRGALWGIFIADSLSMPVHWYYDPSRIVRDFGRIRDFQAPKSKHPSSIMNLSNTGGHGRGGSSGNVIGGVILHDKKKFWGASSTIHYHQGMKAGENTLNALVARVLLRSIAERKRFDPDAFLDSYIKFMTTPGTHNDTYAESFHRDFFKNWSEGVEPRKCAGEEGHNTASAGGLVILPPVALLHSYSRSEAREKVLECLELTHRSQKLSRYAAVYAELLVDVLDGNDLRSACSKAANAVGEHDMERLWKHRGDDTDVIGGRYTSACYIEGSFPSILYLAGRYADDFESAIVANTNCGGENAHRGSALGALMGASVGLRGIPRRWVEGLAEKEKIEKEIEDVVELIMATRKLQSLAHGLQTQRL